MADCELSPTCIFFNEQMEVEFPVAVETMKLKFCRGNKFDCARYRVFAGLGRERVPKDLIPIDTGRAKRILSDG